MNTLNEIKRLWSEKKEHNGESMHLYLHSPFCVGICKYCMYKSIDIKDVEKKYYDMYFEALVSQIKEFQDILGGFKIDSVYFGGGTPSLIPFDTLKKISKVIPNWEKIPVKVFEANPISMNRDKIDDLVDMGYTYLSLGVQTLDEQELNVQNRKYPRGGHLKDITEYALGKGMHVNYDIMVLINDDIGKDMDRLYRDITEIMKDYKPPSIDIYPMDQKLNDITEREILDKIQPLRKIIKKAVYYNEEYRVSGNKENTDVGNINNILSTYKNNYHLLNMDDKTYFTEKKLYSCSGPRSAPMHQNVISFGGHEGREIYNYASNRDFVYYSHIDNKGKSKYRIEVVK